MNTIFSTTSIMLFVLIKHNIMPIIQLEKFTLEEEYVINIPNELTERPNLSNSSNLSSHVQNFCSMINTQKTNAIAFVHNGYHVVINVTRI